MKTLLKWLTVILALSVFLVGCGESSKNEQNSESNKTSNLSQEKKPVKLKFTFWGSPMEKKAVEDAIASFEKAHTGITIESMHIPQNEFLTKLNAMIAGGEAPDLSYSQEWNLKMGEDGLIHNFYELLAEDSETKVGDYLDYAWWNWDKDKSVGPFQSAVTTSLMYNTELLKAANVPLPPTKVEDAWTWDEFVEVAKKLTIDRNGKDATQPDFDPKNIQQFGVKFSLNWASYMPMVLSNGGDYLVNNGTEFGLSKPEATEALQKIADLINVHHVHPSPVQSSSLPAPATALQSKKVAMVVDGSFNQLDLSNSGFEWGVGVLPVFDDYKTFFYGGTLVIFKSTEHLEEALLFYKWLTNPEIMIDMHQSLWMPQLKAWYEDPQLIEKWASEDLPARPDGFQDAVMRSTYENAVPAARNNVKNFAEINALVSAALDQVWLGGKTAEQAMTEIEERVKPLVAGTYLD